MKTFRIGGVLMHDGGNNPFPHDGEGKAGHSCTGYGCDCDEQSYGHYSGGGSSGGGADGTAIFLIAIVVCSIIGAFNQLLAALIIIIVGFVLFVSR